MRASALSTSTAGPWACSGAGSASTTRAARSTRWTRSATTGSCAARSSPAGGCCGATRGAAGVSTTSNSRGSSDDPRLPALAAREHPPQRSRLAARLGRALVGVVDRRPDRDGPAAARPADGQADPLDAEPPALRAADEGDPAEVQGGQAEAAGRADEVLQGEQHQPDGLVPADAGAVPSLHRALPGPAALREAPSVPGPHRPFLRQSRRLLLAAQLRAEHRRARERPLVRLRPARPLRGEPARLDRADVGGDGQDAADDVPDPAADLRLLPAQLPHAARPLLGDDEPLDRGPGLDHAPDDAEGPAAAEALVAHAAPGGERAGRFEGGACPGDGAGGGAVAAEACQAEEEGRREAMTEALQVEATGETVGEAKWTALRELEKLQPGIDKAAVQFQVLSEGERGLLGVGYTPARVLASVDPAATVAPAPAPAEEPASELGGEVREILQQILEAIGVASRVELREDDESLVATVAGRELGLVIGKHGQTIDAIQYLVNAIVWRAHGDERKPVVVDAAGYRARREEALGTLAVRSAERAKTSGRPVELDPMTAVERKVVHLDLKDVAGVTTRSEGTEPNRFVVVEPE